MANQQQSPPSNQDQRQSTRIICGGGLDSTENHLNLSENKPGCATKLVNYEVGLTGGYRRINGYVPYDSTYQEVGAGVAEGAVLGIILYENAGTGVTSIIAARKDIGANQYHFYLYTAGVGWVQINTGLTHVYQSASFVAKKLRWDLGNNGASNVLCVVDSVNNALLYDGTTWGFIKSANTGADMTHAGGNQAINAPAYVCFYSHTLHLAGDTIDNKSGIIAYSAPNTYYDFTVANGAGQMTTGIYVVQIKPFRDSLYIFGKHAIKKAVANTTSGFLVSDVTSNIGCIATDSVLEIGGDLIFLAPDGIRPVSGTNKIGDVELESISKPAQLMITQKAASNDLLDLNGVVVRSKSQFRYFIGGSVYAALDAPGIIGGLRDTSTSYTSDGSISNGWEFGELVGIRTSCVASRYIGSTEYVVHGDYDGKVYLQESGNTFNGSNIFSQYSTPYFDLGDTQVRKVFDKLVLFIRGEGALTIGLQVDYDWALPDAINPAQYTVDINSTAVTYGQTGVEYGDGTSVYGGVLATKTLTDIQGSFFSARLTFTTHASSFPYSIHAMIMEYSVKGRR